jgi:ubiquinone/menaquinone biosynthesis C-methylase UbiE
MRRPPRRDNDYNEYVKDFYRKIEDYDWNQVTDHWSGPESLLHRSRERALTRLVRQYGRGDRYLDVGCGTGLILRHLPAGAVGIDLNPRHLERAARYAPQARVQTGDAEKLSFPDGSFSTVVFTEILEHLVQPEQALAEIFRVLEPGGRLLGSTPRWSLVWRFRFLSSTHYHNEPFHNEFTTSEIRDLFAAFKVLELRTIFLRANFLFALEKPLTAAAATSQASLVPAAENRVFAAGYQPG